MAGKDTGTVNIHGKDYKTVASRVQAFRELHGDKYSIETFLVERTADDVVMLARIKDVEGRLIATGYAEEKRTSSQINRTSALENAETSAIGRALAAFGLAGTEYASADEVAQAITQQRSPQENVKQVFPEAESAFVAQTEPKRAPGRISDKQLAFMQANFNTLGLNERHEKHLYVEGVIGRPVESATDLSLGEAKKVIDRQLADIEDKGGEA